MANQHTIRREHRTLNQRLVNLLERQPEETREELFKDIKVMCYDVKFDVENPIDGENNYEMHVRDIAGKYKLEEYVVKALYNFTAHLAGIYVPFGGYEKIARIRKWK